MSLFSPRRQQFLAERKARQAVKLRELKEVLVADGIRSLDEQARALGLSRSTTWSILQGSHKASGLSAKTINRILATPGLSPHVRAKIYEYIEEKAAGQYGHSELLRRLFVIRLANKPKGRVSKKSGAQAQADRPNRSNGVAESPGRRICNRR